MQLSSGTRYDTVWAKALKVFIISYWRSAMAKAILLRLQSPCLQKCNCDGSLYAHTQRWMQTISSLNRSNPNCISEKKECFYVHMKWVSLALSLSSLFLMMTKQRQIYFLCLFWCWARIIIPTFPSTAFNNKLEYCLRIPWFVVGFHWVVHWSVHHGGAYSVAVQAVHQWAVSSMPPLHGTSHSPINW